MTPYPPLLTPILKNQLKTHPLFRLTLHFPWTKSQKQLVNQRVMLCYAFKNAKKFESKNLYYLLFLLNLSFENGFCPVDWKSATILPLLKPGKPKDDPLAYRPISITSSLGECFERMVNSRLNWHLESHNFIPINQAVFRKSCFIHDHIWNLESTMISGFNKGMKTHCVFSDLNKAYY